MEGLERSGKPGMEPLQLRTPPSPRRPSVSVVSRVTTGLRSQASGVCDDDYKTPSSRRQALEVLRWCRSSIALSSHISGFARGAR